MTANPSGTATWRRTGAVLALGLAVGLGGCTKKEEILEGERLDIRAPLDATATAEEANKSLPVRLGKPRSYAEWTHRNGNTGHRVTNLVFRAAPEVIWSTKIGAGNSRKARLSADPVIRGGRIFVMDAAGKVSAVSMAGEVAWTRDLRPVTDPKDEISGGGLAADGDALYVTTGFGEAYALDAATGAERWRQRLDAPAAAAPLVAGGQVYVMTRDDRAVVLDTRQGRIQWTAQSTITETASTSSAAPADAGRVVVLPFGSGELSGVLKKSGIRLWTGAVSGGRKDLAISAAVSDITSDPVIDGGRIYAGNRAGRLIAFERQTGERIWTATEGSLSPVWPEGGSVFMVSDASKLVRLSSRDGSVIWSVDLPRYAKIVAANRWRQEKRKGGYTHYGPIMAGGRLWVGSGDDRLRSFDPVDGTLLSEIKVPGGVASHMAIVGGVMYFLTGKGELMALQ